MFSEQMGSCGRFPPPLPVVPGCRSKSVRAIRSKIAGLNPDAAPGIQPGQYLAAFKDAAPSLSCSGSMILTIDWLFRFTRPQDWQPGQSPIVWPSAALQQEFLGLSASQIKVINRRLIDAGLILMRDSPNRKRFGTRDREGRIVEAYGFDLSPLRARHSEFRRIAQEAKDRRVQIAQQRRRYSALRTEARSLLEQYQQKLSPGSPGEGINDAWAIYEAIITTFKRSPNRLHEAIAAMAGLIELVEKAIIRESERMEQAESPSASAPEPSSHPPLPEEPGRPETSPRQPENRPHQYIYETAIEPFGTTVVAHGKVVRRPEIRTRGTTGDHDDEPSTTVTPAEIGRLVPELEQITGRTPRSWDDVLVGADALRKRHGIPDSIWGDACLQLGRPKAAIAIAVLSSKPDNHFVRSRSAYFRAMLQRARSGELHLDRSVWGLRRSHMTSRDPAVVR